MNLSKITAIGAIATDVEVRFTNDNTQVSHFDLDMGGGTQLRCNCWGKLADATKNLKISDQVFVVGTLIVNSQKSEHSTYANKKFQITVREIYILRENNIFALAREAGKNSDHSASNLEDLSDVFDSGIEDEVPF